MGWLYRIYRWIWPDGFIGGEEAERPARAPWGESTRFWTDEDWEWFRSRGTEK